MEFNQAPYEAPTILVVGKLHEITKAGAEPSADVSQGQANTGFLPGS